MVKAAINDPNHERVNERDIFPNLLSGVVMSNCFAIDLDHEAALDTSPCSVIVNQFIAERPIENVRNNQDGRRSESFVYTLNWRTVLECASNGVHLLLGVPGQDDPKHLLPW